MQVPVILATQVLESITVEPRPTRAEVSDAANAVEDGVDAIMLSAETAAGAWPVRAVEVLDAVIRETEAALSQPEESADEADARTDHAAALCAAAVTLAGRGGAEAIVAVTRSGQTPRLLSALRPRVPILAATDRLDIARRLAPYWGVVPVCMSMAENIGAAGLLIGQQLMRQKLVSPGDRIVFVNIHEDLTRTNANYLLIQQL